MSRIIDQEGRVLTEDGEIIEEGFKLLDTYSEDGEAKLGRPDWIGTISAGYKDDKGVPHASHDGTIYVSGDKQRCAGLVASLAANENKRLTVAFLSDDLNGFIFQRFTRRSRSALEVYGDQHSLTEIVQKRDGEGKVVSAQHIEHPAGTREYKDLRKTCKVEVSVLFALAEWDGQRTAVTFPDGLGAYRIRFTSRNSLQGLVGKIEEIKARITRGRIAGVPFDLFLVNRDVPGPTGVVRNVPVWTIEFRPPEAIRLTSGNLAKLLGGALNEGQRLQVLLPAPSYGIDDALAEETDVDLEASDQAVEILTSGDPPCDARYWEAQWFVNVRGTRFASDKMRADFVAAYTSTSYDSLSAFLSQATEQEASGLLAALAREIEDDRLESRLKDAAADEDKRAMFAARAGFAPSDTQAHPRMGIGIDGESVVIEHEPDEEWVSRRGPESQSRSAAEHVAAGYEAPIIEHEPPTAQDSAALGQHESRFQEPAPKSKARQTTERNYAQLMIAAGRLGIDLAGYEVDASTSDDALGTLVGKLAAEIRVKTEGVATAV